MKKIFDISVYYSKESNRWFTTTDLMPGCESESLQNVLYQQTLEFAESFFNSGMFEDAKKEYELLSYLWGCKVVDDD